MKDHTFKFLYLGNGLYSSTEPLRLNTFNYRTETDRFVSRKERAKQETDTLSLLRKKKRKNPSLPLH